MSGAQKTICIVSLSPVQSDARVLRHIKYAARRYRVIAVGYGDKPDIPGESTDFEWVRVPETTPPHYDVNASWWGRRLRVLTHLSSVEGLRWLFPELIVGEMDRYLPLLRPMLRTKRVKAWLLREAFAQQALRESLHGITADLVHANEWSILRTTAAFAEATGAKLLVDFHEYAQRQFIDEDWTARVRPFVLSEIRAHSACIDAAFVVSADIARAFKEDFQLEPAVLHNCPELEERAHAEARAVAASAPAGPLRLVHHGRAPPHRQLEKLIDVVAHCDPSVSLTFFLIARDHKQVEYVEELKRHAQRRAPGRVHFEPALAVEQIVPTLRQFDMSLFRFDPRVPNDDFCLPNKLFDSMHAGLAICTAPHTSLKAFVSTHEIGVVGSDFDPKSIARALDGLDAERLAAFKANAQRLASVYCAEVEMQKLLDAYARLLGEVPDASQLNTGAGRDAPPVQG